MRGSSVPRKICTAGKGGENRHCVLYQKMMACTVLGFKAGKKPRKVEGQVPEKSDGRENGSDTLGSPCPLKLVYKI